MVSSTHWLASQTGMAVLEQGGNAFDAAAAAGFVLQVVEPHLNGPAGEVPILGWSTATQQPFVICGQGVAPAAATPAAFAELGLNAVPGTGLLAACVPGAFGAWLKLLRDHGTMRLAEILRYATEYASAGFPLHQRAAATITAVAGMFRASWPTSAAIWLPGGIEPEPGMRMRNPALARTYSRILTYAQITSRDRDTQIEAANDAFYRGFIANEVDDFMSNTAWTDSTGQPHRGLLRGDDLAAWTATEERPLAGHYLGHTVLKPGPWSQGPVLLQQLALLDGTGIQDMHPGSVEYIHTIIECAKLAFADRDAYYGDPKFVDVPITDLLSKNYNDQRRTLIAPTAAHGSLNPGSPGRRTPGLPKAKYWGEAIAPTVDTTGATGEPTVHSNGETRGDTCHVAVADRWGNLVSATPSGGWLQSSPAIPTLGFSMGTRAQMFCLQTGLPNSLEPGKRPRTTLSPSIALHQAKGYLAFGTPGGDQQDQWQVPFLLRHLDQGLNLQQAIDAPNWHTTHFPSSFYPHRSQPGHIHVEARVDPGTISKLRDRGHHVVVEGDWSLGRIHAVSNGPDGMLHAAANPRGMQGYACGR